LVALKSVHPLFAVFFGEPGVACAILGGVAAQVDGDALDTLDLAFDVIALRSLWDHREEPTKTNIFAIADLDVDQAAIAD
jgi:hypothetical protein